MAKEILACLSLVIAASAVGGCDEAEGDDALVDGAEAFADEQDSATLPAAFAAPAEDLDASYFVYGAQQRCTTNGGGTWGSILKLCVSIPTDLANNSIGTFIIYKKDGSRFTTPGTLFLREGSPHGKTHVAKPYGSGHFAHHAIDNFAEWSFKSGYIDYYAYLASSGGGHSWVGPIRVDKVIDP